MCNTDKMLKRLGNYKCDGQLSIFDIWGISSETSCGKKSKAYSESILFNTSGKISECNLDREIVR